jgi:ATP-dependent DNA helicase RecG
MINLTTPIEKIARVGPKNLPRLKKLGIKTVKDLLWHFPARYENLTNLVPISKVEPGTIVSIRGKILDIKNSLAWRKRKKMAITTAVVGDGSGSINAVWFNQPFIEKNLPPGTAVSLAGRVILDRRGLYLSSPYYEKYLGASRLTHTSGLVPIYPETEGLTSKYLRFLIKSLLANLGSLADPLPEELIRKYNLPKLDEALRSIHFPKGKKEADLARQRFALEELLLFQLRVLRDHRQLQALQAPVINFDEKLIASFVSKLPFQLTNDQRIAAYEILQDLKRSYPMNRLLNGDVGSGKTVVALIAAYQTALAGYQVVFMAPTEILAQQHYQTIKNILADNFKSIPPDSEPKLKIGLLTGSEAKQWSANETAKEKISKKLMVQKIANGQIDIIVGTHAVIQKNIRFKNLGLVVIDEQHRFGVEQRMKLIKGDQEESGKRVLIPHLLSMTATPIPRTLALTIFGDLDISLLKEKPKGRQTIITKVVLSTERDKTYQFIEEEIQKGRQVFVICPRIELPGYKDAGSGQLSVKKLVWAEVKAVTEEYKKLSEKVFPHRRLAMLHGKMKPAEKNKIMEEFKNGHYDILVSTSVIEVGVDVPNASIMMIESAERFGLAQLHQFRGRVGRGEYQSYCFLFTDSDSGLAYRRLGALERTDNGFELAEMDLKIRGPGEFSGVRQSGIPDFAMTSLADIDLVKKARLEAKLLLKEDPTLKKSPLLLERLSEIQRLVHFE